MSTQTHEFDSLNIWASMSDSEIEAIISGETITTMQQVVYLLADESECEKIVVNRDNFVSLVHKMRELYKIGSRSLGEAILKASEFVEKKEVEKAKEIYKHFLSSCVSKFYKDIAIRQLDKL